MSRLADWPRVDDLLGDVRTVLRIWERQPAIGRDIAYGLNATLPELRAAALTDDARQLCDDLTEATRRAAQTHSPEIRERQIIAARIAVARLDLLVATDRHDDHDRRAADSRRAA